MFKTLRNALQIEEIRKKLLYTLLILVIVRFGSLLPLPGVNSAYLAQFVASMEGTAFNFFDALTGGSFSSMSLFALGISPYITASIIMQLLTIAIPKLEEMQKDGEEGRKKINKISRYVTIGLAMIQSSAMAISFGRQGLLTNYNFFSALILVIGMTGGTALLMWLGERITEKGVGNGISIILLINILSSLPNDLRTLYNKFVAGEPIPVALIAIIIILVVLLVLIVFVIYLQDGERNVPVQYSQKVQGRKLVGGSSSGIPIKVNTAGVIPVIFASSLMSFPVVIANFFTVNDGSVGSEILKGLTSSNWANPKEPIYSIGLIIYLGLIILFAYFYTSITFNPIEVAGNLKKQGGFIPGIRPGKPTSEFLTRILNYIVFLGAVGLIIVALIPILVSGFFGIGSLSLLGTSLIIIVGVILETIKAVESMMTVRYYKGFLNN